MQTVQWAEQVSTTKWIQIIIVQVAIQPDNTIASLQEQSLGYNKLVLQMTSDWTAPN